MSKVPPEIFQIAIDGPAASGKSTVARLLAERIGGYYVNTGDMYRTLAWAAGCAGIDVQAEPARLAARLGGWNLRYGVAPAGVLQLYFNGEPVRQTDIRAPEVTAQVSHVACIPAVRSWMLERQRECAGLGRIVMEGRDIGTVIFPRARYKFFLTASPLERARRRLAQQSEVSPESDLQRVALEIGERDRIDSTRAVAPLKAAADALILATDGMTQDEVVAWLLKSME